MYWKHSYYEILKNIVGACHTTDEAYKVTLELIDDRRSAVEGTKAEYYRARSRTLQNEIAGERSTEEIKILSKNKSNRLFIKSEKADVLMAKAFIKEQRNRTHFHLPCLQYAIKEIGFLENLRDILEPVRKYRDYENFIAFQLGQADEMYYDILWTAYCELLSLNTITVETVQRIKQHGGAELFCKINCMKKESYMQLAEKTKTQLFGTLPFLVCNVPLLNMPPSEQVLTFCKEISTTGQLELFK